MPPRILLLQARNHDDLARLEERQSFADKARLDIEQIVPYDLLSGTPTLREALGYDALMVGGSGDFYVSKGKASVPRSRLYGYPASRSGPLSSTQN